MASNLKPEMKSNIHQNLNFDEVTAEAQIWSSLTWIASILSLWGHAATWSARLVCTYCEAVQHRCMSAEKLNFDEETFRDAVKKKTNWTAKEVETLGLLQHFGGVPTFGVYAKLFDDLKILERDILDVTKPLYDDITFWGKPGKELEKFGIKNWAKKLAEVYYTIPSTKSGKHSLAYKESLVTSLLTKLGKMKWLLHHKRVFPQIRHIRKTCMRLHEEPLCFLLDPKDDLYSRKQQALDDVLSPHNDKMQNGEAFSKFITLFLASHSQSIVELIEDILEANLGQYKQEL